jgi:PAS domain S-box-containing protein
MVAATRAQVTQSARLLRRYISNRKTSFMKDQCSASSPEPATARKLLGWLIIALAIVALLITAAIQNDTRQAESGEWITHNRALVAETVAIVASLHSAESAQNIYILTGDETAKKLAAERFVGVDKHLKAATTLAIDNSAQLDRVGAISALLQKRIELNKQATALIAQGPSRAAKVFATPEARADLQQLEKLVRDNRAIENRGLLQHEKIMQRHTRRTEQILYAGGGLTLILMGVAFRSVLADLKVRRGTIAMLKAELAEVAAEVDATNEKLQLENMGQKWGQAALQRIVGHHELVLNSIRDGVFVVSKNGNIISANPAAADLVRRELRQLAGKSIGSILLDEDRLPFPWEKHFLRSPLKNGRPVLPKPATIKQADGGLLDVQMSCHPTRDRDNLTGAVITVSAAVSAALTN